MRAREEAASAASSRVPRAAALWAARWPKPLRHCRSGFALRFGAKRVQPLGWTRFIRRSVRGIFPAVRAAGKNDLSSFRRGRKPGRGFGPFLDFSGDGGPRSAACFCWECLLSAWPRSGFGGEGAAAAAGRGTGAGASPRAGDGRRRTGDEGRGTGDEGRRTGDEGRGTRDVGTVRWEVGVRGLGRCRRVVGRRGTDTR